MDHITKKYNQALRVFLTSLVSKSLSTAEDIEVRLLHDEKKSDYLLLMLGWKNTRYSHGVIIHAQVLNGKIWIHQDRSDFDVREELMEAGVPNSDIVLGYVPKYLRPETEGTAVEVS